MLDNFEKKQQLVRLNRALILQHAFITLGRADHSWIISTSYRVSCGNKIKKSAVQNTVYKKK